ncbi:ABC transporter ATP-binding protein [Kutzneria kofuensis]|uniref:Peptide/nickel transport system ATP-binding protein n=1 Tax=Kutzneria kofuensis TaxID=103725 RepID=A0A7W9KP20_9PSEU|nr:oligopeptide/dipeptide ABC transporter ATP-binding protein [Kutzneria kofuensis]MBB5896114.1 peptide/nickel transport system ATP-binding protein [Kutzneria kofuensis]
MTTLHANNLVKDYTVRRTRLRAVDDVTFTLTPGRTLGLVGESGSGKSTVAKLLTRLEKPSGGSIGLTDADGAAVPDRQHRHHVQMVFQDPFASLNPFHTVEHHIARPLRLHHRAAGKQETREQVARLLERVNLDPEEFTHRRPHELSGGQRQRVAIARALAPGAQVVIADEPVSMLDVSIRLGVLSLLARLQREEQLAVLYITHDLATARHFSDDVIVMYRGRIVERGPADEVILRPRHPYTRLLAASAPNPDARTTDGRRREDPAATRPPDGAGGGAGPGCGFRDRCPLATATCAQTPPDEPVGPGHLVKCWHPGDES